MISISLLDDNYHLRSNHMWSTVGINLCSNLYMQILVQHIRAVLPALKSRINSQLVAVAKADAAYGDVAESKVHLIISQLVVDLLLACLIVYKALVLCVLF